MAQQQAHNVNMLPMCCGGQRRVAQLTRSVHGSAVLQQQLHRGQTVDRGGVAQRRDAKEALLQVALVPACANLLRNTRSSSSVPLVMMPYSMSASLFPVMYSSSSAAAMITSF